MDPVTYFAIALLGCLPLCGVAAYIASKKGRSGIGLFFLSLLLSPLVGIIVALVMNPDREIQAQRQGLKRCSSCAEFVQPSAKICRFCQHNFVEEEAAAEAQRQKAATERAAARKKQEIEDQQQRESGKLTAEQEELWARWVEKKR